MTRYNDILAVGMFLAAHLAAQTGYKYDVLNRLTRVSYSDGTTIAYTYDAAGNRLSQVIANPSIALPSISVDKNALTFSVGAGQTTPTQIVVVKNAGGGNLQWDAVTAASWLTVTPGSGTNSGAVNVTASASGLSAGTYNASVMILASASNTPLTIPVIFTVTAAQGSPTIMNGGIVSAAGSSSAIARGSIASIYGSSLADGPAVAATVPLPRTLGNVQVSVNGINAPLFYTNSKQINFQVPFEAPLQGQASVVVTRDDVASAPMNVALVPYAPSVFTYERTAGVFDPIIVHAKSNQLVTPANPAVPGEYLVVYGTGIGDLTVLPATGETSPENPPATAKLTPTATVGRADAAVTFAGLTPNAIGLAQFNIQVPNSLPAGSALPLVISFGSANSAPVSLAISGGSVSGQVITTIAGNGAGSYSGDGGPATSAALNQPTRIVADSTGAIFILDASNNRVRKIALDGTITTVAGNGTNGFSGDGGPATNASLSLSENPFMFAGGLAVDSAGDLYISDVGNNRVRRVSPSGIIETIAGTGDFSFSGDGGPATNAALRSPQGLAMDGVGNLYIADAGNHRVRQVTASGTIATIAGNGGYPPLGDGGPATSAYLNYPTDIAFDTSGDLYIVDYNDCRLRLVNTLGVMETAGGNGQPGFAGDGGPAISASLYGPQGVAIDALGNIYIADLGNNRVRMISPDGIINTIAGTGEGGFSGDGGPAHKAQLAAPAGVAVAGGTLIADTLNNRVRLLESSDAGLFLRAR